VARRIDPEEIIAKEFSATYDRAVSSFLRKHHNTPVGEKAPSRLNSIITGNHPLNSQQQLYEEIGRSIIEKKAKYFDDSSVLPITQQSAFSHKYGSLPGYIAAIEQYSHLPKDRFLQLAEKHKNDLYSPQAIRRFHAPIKDEMLAGIIDYFETLPEEKSTAVVQKIVDRERTYYAKISEILPDIEYQFTMMYIDSLDKIILPVDIPYFTGVRIATRDKALKLLDMVEGNFTTYFKQQLDDLEQSGVSQGNLQQVLKAYFSEVRTIFREREEDFFTKEFPVITSQLANLLVQRISGNADSFEGFNPLKDVVRPELKSPLTLRDYINNPQDLRATKKGDIIDPFGKKLSTTEVIKLKNEGIKPESLPRIDVPQKSQIIDYDSLDLSEDIHIQQPDGTVTKLTPKLLNQLKEQGIKLQTSLPSQHQSDFAFKNPTTPAGGTSKIPLEDVVDKNLVVDKNIIGKKDISLGSKMIDKDPLFKNKKTF
jgi:hypothetical protein